MQTFDPDGKTNRMSMTMVPLMFPWLPERHINAQKNFAPSGLLHLHHQFCRHALGWEWLSKFLASWCLLSLVSVQANANFKKNVVCTTSWCGCCQSLFFRTNTGKSNEPPHPERLCMSITLNPF